MSTQLFSWLCFSVQNVNGVIKMFFIPPLQNFGFIFRLHLLNWYLVKKKNKAKVHLDSFSFVIREKVTKLVNSRSAALNLLHGILLPI